MSENLQDMLDGLTSEISKDSNHTEENRDLSTTTDAPPPIEPFLETQNIEDPVEIQITNFYYWFENIERTFENLNRVKTEVANVDTKDTMIFKVPKISKNTKDSAMELVSFYNPSIRPILNLPPNSLRIFKNDTFEVYHQYINDMIIKSYGLKTGLIVILCVNIDNKIIPYHKIKIKKDETGLTSSQVIKPNVEKIKEKLNQPLDTDLIQLLYKQSSKNISNLHTNEDAINYLLIRYPLTVDINHLLKLDSSIISLLSN